MSNNKDVKRGIVLYIDGKEVKRDVTDIKAEIRKLTKELDHMTIGSKEYNEQMSKIRHLNSIVRDHKSRLREVNEELGKSRFNVGKLVDGFNRFGGVIVSVIGFLTGFVLALRSIREERNKLEESQAGLKALTGLDDESITWLTAQAKTLSTTMTKEGLRVRQSAAEILDAFMLVGSAKPELLGDKEALRAVTEEAMRLQAAAKDITLNEAVDSLTLSLNQYGAAADKAGRYSNVLAAGSKEGSANIASQAKAIRTAGTSAASANVSIEQTVGLIETLAYRGIKDEVAGTGLKRFFLKLQTGADETNPKIVGLDKALENLKNKKMDAGAIKTMFGEEGFNAASVILQNTEMVKDFTKAVTGTNVAYEQSAINSATAAAKLDQARNKMKLAAIELGEKLNPAFVISTNMMTNVIKFLPGLIDWFQKWGGTVLYVASVIAIYTLRSKAATIATTAWNAVTKIATALQIAYGVAVNTISGYTVTSFTQLRRLTTLMAGHNIMLKTIRVSTYLFSGAMQVLQGRVDLAAKSMRAAWAVMKLTPAATLSTVLFAAGAAFVYLYWRAHEYMTVQKATNKLQKEAAESTSDQRKALDTLWVVAQNNNLSMQKRREAMEKINKISPQYLGDITLETINTQKAADAKARYVEQLQKEAMLKGAYSHIEEESKKLVEYQSALDEAIKGQKKAREGATYAQTGFTAYDAPIEQLTSDIAHTKEAIKSYTTIYEQINKELNAAPAKEVRTIESVTKELDNAKTVLEELKNTNTKYFSSGELISYNARLKQAAMTVTKLTDEVEKLKKAQEPTTTNNGESEEEREKRIKTALEKIETGHNKRIVAIKQKYLADDTMTQEQYNEQMQQAEMQLLNDKLDVAGLEPGKRQEIADKILDIQIQMKEKRLAIGLTETKEILSAQKKRLQLELESTAKDYKKHLISREAFLEKIKDLQKKYGKSMPELPKLVTEEQQKELEKYLEKLQEIIDKYNEMEEEPKKWNETVQKNWEEINKYTDASSEEMTAIIASLVMDLFNLKIDGTESFKSLEDSGEAMFALLGTLGKQFGLAMGEMLAGEEEAVGEFLKSTLNMVLTAIEQLMIAYIAQTTMRNIAEMGVWGLLKAAGEIALITAAFESVKGLVGNFYTGGYTGSGDWDQPQGIVHSNEFVANRYAVANPAIRPVLDLIDSAQRTGSIANLTSEDIASVVPRSLSLVSSGSASRVSESVQVTDPALLAMLNECNHAIRLLKIRLDEPFVTENYVTGRHGIEQALNLYNKLKSNVSRP